MSMKKTVVAGLLRQGNRFLICQRPAPGDFPGKWEFPGGKIKTGENLQAALCRELQEELGIASEIGEEVWCAKHQYPGYAPVLLFFFAVIRYQGTAENRVFQQICWVDRWKLPEYDFLEADRSLVQKIASGEIQVPSAEHLAGLFSDDDGKGNTQRNNT